MRSFERSFIIITIIALFSTSIHSITHSNIIMESVLSYRLIGAGNCGTVWAPPTPEGKDSMALKREDGGSGRSLALDNFWHNRILASLDQLNHQAPPASTQQRVQVPQCFRFIEGTDSAWWSEHSIRFPEGPTARNVLQSERIPPLPRVVRERLIAKYCPAALIDEIKASVSNQNCLVRPYLGRRRHGADRPRRLEVFSLKNFPLHLDQMEQLKLNVKSYAETMAEALAMMHWMVGTDASDVEFVLAPPRNPVQTPSDDESATSFLGEHTMWMLDFDCCRPMPTDDEGVKKAVTAFFRNDPFFPRPCAEGSRDRELWEIFRSRYLQISSHILGDDFQQRRLPDAFIKMIEEERCGKLLVSQSVVVDNNTVV